jgi:hypothetical protein
MESEYECPVHKIIELGIKRENFKEEFYSFLLHAPMQTSMRLYKEVNVDCHCKKNYQAFDAIQNSTSVNS